jgi:hypothetical protein
MLDELHETVSTATELEVIVVVPSRPRLHRDLTDRAPERDPQLLFLALIHHFTVQKRKLSFFSTSFIKILNRIEQTPSAVDESISKITFSLDPHLEA